MNDSSRQNRHGKDQPAQGSHQGPHKGPRKTAPERVWLYGRHPVLAALQNPERRKRRVAATRNAAAWLVEQGFTGEVEDMTPAAIDQLLPPGAVHQGLAGEFFDLPRARLKEACDASRPGAVLVLDQVTDPQNVGALLRVAAAMGAQAVVAQDRRTPPVSGALAKAAAGAAERVPLVRVVNVARALEALKELGFRTAGLAGGASLPLPDYAPEEAVALVVGAEGAGLRQLVAQTCDNLVSIPMAAEVESLNVSTAAAIALYALKKN
jgi:23S rRNA (guanosine2251-2'-O)-methyltransferase